jgi:hypothetical protein
MDFHRGGAARPHSDRIDDLRNEIDRQSRIGYCNHNAFADNQDCEEIQSDLSDVFHPKTRPLGHTPEGERARLQL